jgi:glycosyltransferase involved in cell wall biosynthesis
MLLLKVGVFHPPIHPKYFGGSIAVTIPIVNALAEDGYEVVLFVNNNVDQGKINEMMGERISPLVKTIFKPSFLQPRGLLDLYKSAFELLTLKLKCDLVIDTYSCYVFPMSDVCYIHFPYLNNYTFGQHFPYLKKRRGCLIDAVNLPYIFFERNFERYDEKLLLANSHFTSKAIKESLGANAKVLYPPISPLFFQDNYITSSQDQRENLVVTIGRITEDKKMEAIPQIANILRGEDIRFFIIGFAHSEDILRKIDAKIRELDLKEKVKIFPDISREEMKKILGRAKVYLHPPTIEHFGISIAEAMALGCLPIVYDLGGVKEFVPAKFRYKNIIDAAHKVTKNLNEWSVEKAMEMRKIVEKFKEENFSRNFIHIFERYINEKENLRR